MNKKEIVEKLTEEHKDTIKQWAKESNKEVKELVDEFCEVYGMEQAKEAFGDDDERRIQWAMKVIHGRIANEMATPTEKIELYVLGIEPPRTNERDDGSTFTVGSVFGIGAVPSSDSLKKINVTGWGEQAKKVNQIEYGKGYSLNVSRQNKQGDSFSYNFESHTEVEEIDFEPDNIPKLLKQFFPHVKIAEATENVSKNPNDYKMVKGIIEDINITMAKTGKRLARYSIYDGSIPTKDIGETGLFTVMMPAEMAQFGPDSEVCFVGTINNSEQYGPGMFAAGIADILGIPHEPDLSNIDEETITVEDANDATTDESEVEDANDEFGEFI